jgi:hypothetical protein
VFGISAQSGIVHDILIENNTLIGQDGNQQTDGISTKVPTWNWVIRGNVINGAGTGLYLGNSDGTFPFVAGIIENNLVENTIGYDMEIKWQLPRPSVAGMPTGQSFTIIRNNVFIKNDQPSPDGDRPNLLVGGFPSSGPGSTDMYEIYGNFLYHNPREALFQASGRVSVHDNVFVDGQYAAAVFEAQDLPLNLAYVYNNTVYSTNKGIYFGSAAQAGDNVTGNLVFAATPISGAISNSSNNLVDTLANAGAYVNQPSFVLGAMDLYPLAGKVEGSALNLSAFSNDPDYTLDYNGVSKSAAKQAFVFRGAYAGEGTNPGWRLQAGIKPANTGGPAPPVLTSLTCSPLTLTGGASTNCTVSLSSPATVATVVSLTSTGAALSMPATVTVSAAQNSAAFTAATASVSAGSTATVTATLNGVSASATITVNPAPPAVSGIQCSPSSLAPGGVANCTVTLSTSASGAGAVVALSSNNSIVSVPASVTVAAGGSTAAFNATAGTPAAAQTAVISATLNGAVQTSITVLPPGGASFTPIRVNAGAGAYTDSSGNAWSADTGFIGGNTSATNAAVSGTTASPLYQSCRWGTFAYQYAVPNGSYAVTLKFAEIYFSTAGSRVFNVSINGTPALTNFDIVAQAGGALKALDKTFTIAVTGGQINIQFTLGTADQPMVNAIQIAGSAATAPPPAAGSPVFLVNAGGTPYTDASGNAWSGDTDFIGGNTSVTNSTVAGTNASPLYQTCRWGGFTYQIPVSNGSYTVTLKFAEIYFTTPGSRLFNVSINGSPVLTNFDIVSQAGGALKALDKAFPVTVTNGQIKIQFTAGAADQPLVNAIEVQ